MFKDCPVLQKGKLLQIKVHNILIVMFSSETGAHLGCGISIFRNTQLFRNTVPR